MLIDLLLNPGRMANLSLRTWDDTLHLARQYNLLGRLADTADQDGTMAEVPPEVRPHLVAAMRLAKHQREAIRWECRRLEQALADVRTPIVLLKGAAYSMSGRTVARGRLYGDIDILVESAAIPDVEAALRLHGWSAGAIDPYDDRYYRTWMHELPPMAHHDRGSVIDVHHNILPLTSRVVPRADVLLACRVPLPGSRFSVLSPTDMVIHSATHLFHEGEPNNGLRDLLDLHGLLAEFSQLDPDFVSSLVERAKAIGLVWPVALGLRALDRVLGMSLPQHVVKAAWDSSGIGSVREAALDAIYDRTFAPVDSAELRLGHAAARAALYVRGHALRMPLRLLAWHLARKAVLRTFKHTSRSQAK